MEPNIILVFMGVCGCGKTTLAARTARHLECERVIEADEFHTPEMKQKMMSGIPLTDDDRWPWLGRMNGALGQVTQTWSVVTCSALKKAYRQKLAEGLQGSVRFIFLDAPKPVIEERLRHRKHEYMPVSLLDSQLATLERPGPDEPVVRISVSGSEDQTFELILQAISGIRKRDEHVM